MGGVYRLDELLNEGSTSTVDSFRTPTPPLFDPEGNGYDEDLARASGATPDSTGHWPSLDPRTGMVLKGRNHETWHKTVAAEEALGNIIEKGRDGRYYSRRQAKPTPPATQPTYALSDLLGEGLPPEPPTETLRQRYDRAVGRVRPSIPSEIPLHRMETPEQIARNEEVAKMSTGERALEFAKGVGTGAMGVATFPLEVVRPVLFGDREDQSPEARAWAAAHIGTPLTPPLPEGEAAPPTGVGDIVRKMADVVNPVPLIEHVTRGIVGRDPRVLGELGGFVAGGKVVEGFKHALSGPQLSFSKEVMAPRDATAARAFQSGDPYEVLGLDRKTATAADVDAAVRKAASQWHPDLHPNDTRAADVMARFNQQADIVRRDLAAQAPVAGPADMTPEQQTRAAEAPAPGRSAEPSQTGVTSPVEAAPTPTTEPYKLDELLNEEPGTGRPSEATAPERAGAPQVSTVKSAGPVSPGQPLHETTLSVLAMARDLQDARATLKGPELEAAEQQIIEKYAPEKATQPVPETIEAKRQRMLADLEARRAARAAGQPPAAVPPSEAPSVPVDVAAMRKEFDAVKATVPEGAERSKQINAIARRYGPTPTEFSRAHGGDPQDWHHHLWDQLAVEKILGRKLTYGESVGTVGRVPSGSSTHATGPLWAVVSTSPTKPGETRIKTTWVAPGSDFYKVRDDLMREHGVTPYAERPENQREEASSEPVAPSEAQQERAAERTEVGTPVSEGPKVTWQKAKIIPTRQGVQTVPIPEPTAGPAPTRPEPPLGGGKSVEELRAQAQAAEQAQRAPAEKGGYPVLARDREVAQVDETGDEIEYRDRITQALEEGRAADARALYNEATKTDEDGYSNVMEIKPAIEARISAAEVEQATQGALGIEEPPAKPKAAVEPPRVGPPPTTPKVPDVDDDASPITDAEIRRALHQGGGKELPQMAKTGATDEQIMAHFGEKFGIFGGVGIPGERSLSWKGGKNPQLSAGGMSHTFPKGAQTLQGKALINRIRTMYGIGQPGAAAPIEFTVQPFGKPAESKTLPAELPPVGPAPTVPAGKVFNAQGQEQSVPPRPAPLGLPEGVKLPSFVRSEIARRFAEDGMDVSDWSDTKLLEEANTSEVLTPSEVKSIRDGFPSQVGARAPAALPPIGPAPVAPERPVVVDKAPPGGWRPEDKVPQVIPIDAKDIKVGDKFFTGDHGYLTVLKVLPFDPKYPKSQQVETDRGRRDLTPGRIMNVERQVAPTVPAPKIEAGEEVPHDTQGTEGGPVREPAPGELAAEPAGPVEGTRAERPAREPTVAGEPGRGVDEENRPAGPSGKEPRVGGEPPRDVGEAGGRGSNERPGPRAGERGPAGDLRGVDYRITDADALGAGGPKAKVRANIDAIKLLKQIETEGRLATTDEQAQLVRYTGWGAFKRIFDVDPKDWAAEAAELKSLLTPEEWDAARGSVLNAHYTSDPVIRGIWDALDRMGFKGGHVLEPSMGIGHFFGLMPLGMHGKSNLMGVELDPTTGRIAKLLYPNADVRVMGFEKVKIPDGRFDAVVSNIPFGEYKVPDPRYNKLGFSIHNYFFAKALDTVRPGGVVAFVTSRYTMDQADPKVRKYIAERADLLGAIRLPNTAFKGSAGTEVTTDVIFLRKKVPGETYQGESFEGIEQVKPGLRINSYYARHPEMMLGTMALTGTQYGGNEPTLEPHEGQEIGKAFAEAAARLPANAIELRHGAQAAEVAREAADKGEIEGMYAERGGKIMTVENGEWVPVRVPKNAVPRIKGLMGIRDAVRATVAGQLADVSDATLAGLQKDLSAAYDKFVKQYGPINKEVATIGGDEDEERVTRPNLKNFKDSFAPLVMALEDYKAATADEPEKATKAPIFTQRVLRRPTIPEHVDLAPDAMLVSLDAKGDVDIPYMASLTGKSQAEVLSDLRGVVYRDPATGNYEARDAYLSGNVRRKLTQAEAAAKKDAAYQDNLEALKGVQPRDLAPSEISAAIGSSWIPEDDYAAFIEHLLGKTYARGGIKVSHLASEGAWAIDIPRDIASSVRATAEWGTPRRPAGYLIEDAINFRVPIMWDEMSDGTKVKNEKETAAAQEKLQKIKDEFKDWIFKDPERGVRLVKKYNTEINVYQDRKFDGSHLTLAGATMAITPHPHQRNAVWRGLQQGNVLYAHVVGSGKTYTAVMLVMESRRLGRAQKPLITVPNHMLAQFSREFLQMYPAAKILVAGKEDFSKERRKLFAARAATGDWDAIVLTHSSFKHIGVSSEFEQEFLKERMREYAEMMQKAKEQKGDTRMIVRQIEVGKKKLEARLKRVLDREGKDDFLSFEELGIDMMVVDEAHKFKNLETPSQIRNAGLPQGSQRASDLLLKTIYLDKTTPGRGVVFLTATPVSNSLSEVHTMQRYLQPRLLKEHGIEHFDSWVGNFGDMVTSYELKPEGGGIQLKTRFAKFRNGGDLAQMFRQVADVLTAEDVKLPVPKVQGGKAELVIVPATDIQKAYFQVLGRRAEQARGKKPEKGGDNMLKISTDGRKAALDIRLVDPLADDDRTTKLHVAADRIYDIWKKTAAKRSAQMVFADLGAPGGVTFNVYGALKEYLVEKGIPAAEIAFIHDAATDLAKDQMFSKVRSGKIRVLVGSTSKMGEGTNVQKKLIAEHELDSPFKPAEIEQRNGRIIRQGNENPEIQILRYTTEGSFDAFMWQLLQRKAAGIDQFMKATRDTREMDDVDGRALTYGEIKALTTGDPRLMEKAELESDLQRLSRQKSIHDDRSFQVKQKMINLPPAIEKRAVLMKAVGEDVTRRVDTAGDKFKMNLDGTDYTKRPQAAEKLKALADAMFKEIDKHHPEGAKRKIGTFAGFDLMAQPAYEYQGPRLMVSIQGNAMHFTSNEVKPADEGVGILQSIEHVPRRLEADLTYYERKQADAEQDLADAKRLASETFPKAEEFAKKKARLAELDIELSKKVEREPEPTAEMSNEEGLPQNEGTSDEEYDDSEDDEDFGGGGPKVLHAGIPPLPYEAIGKLYEKLGETKVGDDILKMLAPASRPGAREGAGIITHRLGEGARENEVAETALRALAESVPNLNTPEGVEFVDRIETGQQQATKKHQKVANALRDALDGARSEVQALGTGKLEDFIEDYFPHIWEKDKKGIFAKIFGRRPLEGGKAFLKHRTIPTIKEGLDAGLKPVVDSPVEMVLLKLREMRKYITAHRIMNDLHAAGLIKFVRAGSKAPDGAARINDRIATVYGPRTDQGSMTIRGEYWAPEPVARLLNNYLSPGLRGNALYDAFRGTGNTLNAIQLGLSAFHLGFTSLDAALSRGALGIEQIMAGRPLSAAWTFASVPFAPVTNFLKGDKVLREYLRPGTQAGDVREAANALVEAGGRGRMDAFYKNNSIDKFIQNLRRKQFVGAVARAIPAAIELSAKPIMEYVVPRQKLGVFFDLALFELSKLPADATSAQRLEVLQSVWRSVDNRMGQMVYDNLFWNRTLKDLAMVSVRSVGWDWGSIREGVGGVKDLSKGQVTHRGAYVLSLMMGVGLIGAIITYLMTGEGPKELRDYYYPRTGRKNPDGTDERVVLPSYMKDVFSFARHPIQTAEHKLHPLISMVAELLENRDFFGDQIRNPHDAGVVQAREVLDYVTKEITPLGIRAATEETGRKQSMATRALPFIGVTPAPREVVRTPAQNAMAEYAAQHRPAVRTREEADAAQRRRETETGLRTGDVQGSDLAAQIRAGEMTRPEAVRAIKESHQDPDVLRFKGLPTYEAERVYRLASPEERGRYREVFAGKIKREDDRAVQKQALLSFQKLPYAGGGLKAVGRAVKPKEPARTKMGGIR